ncbi:MAG: hypothetical protein MK179_11640 [Pirellulaceae bacterium]|nr:hypothetical protein [Pirellulaceae bacterium]
MVHRKVSLLVCLLAIGCSATQDTSTSDTASSSADATAAVNTVSFNVPDMT